MKKFLAMFTLLLPLSLISGCEPFPTTNDKEGEVEFVNKSTYDISVTPQAQSGWSGFSFAPGERVKLSNVYDVFFTYEPRYRVTVGDNKNGKIVFIDLNENTVEVDTGN